MTNKKFFRPLGLLVLTLGCIPVFLSGCNKEASVSSPNAPEKPAVVSAEKTSFDQVTAKLDKGGNLFVYMSVEQAMTNLNAKLNSLSNFLASLPGVAAQEQTFSTAFEVVQSLINDSGVEHISGVGMSSIAREPNFYLTKGVLFHYPGEGQGGIWTLFGREPHPLKQLDLLPESTVLATFTDLDLGELWQEIQKQVKQSGNPQAAAALAQFPAQFLKQTGLDLDQVLNSLSGNYGVILTMDMQKKISIPLGAATLEIPNPGIALVTRVKSDVIFNRVDALASGNPLVVRVDTANLKMRTTAIPIPLPVELRPSIARTGDYLILASSDTMINEMLDVQSGKHPGFKATAEFKRLSHDLPDTGNNFSLVADRFTRIVMDYQQQLAPKSGMTSNQLVEMQHLFTSATNFGSYSVGVNGADGWMGYAAGSQSMQAAILPAAFAVGAVAAIAVPNFVRARTTAQVNGCINNLRLIDAAKQQWALEKGKQSIDTPTRKDLTPYLGRGVSGTFPTCPAGGHYTIGAVGEKPTCSIPSHELP